MKQAQMCIDCEWTTRGELISMALVADDGAEFYEVVDYSNPGDWVAQNVVPVLHKDPVSRNEFTVRLQNFLRPYDEAVIVADWPEDIAKFCMALIVGPGVCIWTPRLAFIIDRDLPYVSAIPHNALEDARALQRAYEERNTVEAAR